MAVSDRENGPVEMMSVASLSGVSLTLATGYSQHHQLQQLSPQSGALGGRGGGEVVDKEENEEVEGGRESRGKRRLVMELRLEDKQQTPTESPHASSTDDGVQCLLENVPRVKEEFQILSKIGEGTFSSVYLAGLKGRTEVQFALKHLVPTSASTRIENEIKCLQSMGGRDNVIPLLSCVRHRDHVVLIMPYFPHTKLTDYLHSMTPNEVQRYMHALFTALRNIHSHQVIHRDIKPSNFLYDRDNGRYQLVDFGLAHLEPSVAPTTTPSSSTQGQLKASHNTVRGPLLTTHPTSSSAYVTKAPITDRTRRPHPQVHINGTGLVLPRQCQTAYRRRQANRKVQPQSTTTATRGGGEGGKGKDGVGCTERRGSKRRGEERGEMVSGGGRQGEFCGSVCPLRHDETELCDVCQNRSHQNAPRAGTPGFRAPEVLLKCPYQTTAVDVWSAGVVFLCLLSGRYPFFRATDDLSALAQIIALMGTAECTRAAKELGKELVCSQQIDPVDLRELCRTLRRMLHNHLLHNSKQHSLHIRNTAADRLGGTALPPCNKKHRLVNNSGVLHSPVCRYELRSPTQRRKTSPRRLQTLPVTVATTQTGGGSLDAATSANPSHLSSSSSVSVCGGKLSIREITKSWESLPESAYDLLYRCLELNPLKRVTAEEALEHPFLADVVR